jgi:hypothetical protein
MTMDLNADRLRQLIRGFDFRPLFLEELGWDGHQAELEIRLDGRTLSLTAVAQKRGMVVYRCSAPAGESIPEYPERRKIEKQVARQAHEHIIIFTDAENSTQIWQWVRREPGKPAACREHTYHISQPGDALIQKLKAIAFSLGEEEALTLPDVTRRVRAGLDVERVTKRFYDRFKKEHEAFLKFITGITASADRDWYASVMLNRLMFVYFIQRKGFLDSDHDYLRNRLARTRAEHGRDKFYSFYRYFLLRLFHEGLGSRARTPALEKLLGRIPYLNGGLFEMHPVEQRYSDIQIPDKAFENIFSYFDEYHWHLDERPLRADNEINPDVLGYIFEKYINQKQMGAYYTKEDITEYIAKNTVIPFLFDAARAKCKVAFDNPGGPTFWDLLKTDPDRYIYSAVRHGVDIPLPAEIAEGIDTTKPGLLERRKGWNKPAPPEVALPTEIWREVVARRQRCEELRRKLASGEVRDINDLITLNLDIRQFAQDVIENCEGPELLRAFWHAIERVTILDPTCGSGAFLFAALNILEPLYEACLERMEAFVEDLDRSGQKHRPEKFSDFRAVIERVSAHPNPRYFIFKSIILNNLFGVDIMEEAVEICKLRLFLKLAAQVEPDAARDNFGIEPLPDVDFNIRAGNTLVGYATADEVRRVFKEKPSGKRVQYNLMFGETQDAYDRFDDQLKIADSAFRKFRDMQTQQGMDAKDFAEAKQTLRNRLKSLEDELNRHLAGEYGVKLPAGSGKKGKGESSAYEKWLKSHQSFHWFVEFYGIMQSGGFDVIIGNPPYVEYRKVINTYRLPRGQYASESAGNLYAFCMERSCRLLRLSGWFGMIVPTGLLGLDESLSLRDVLITRFNRNWFSTYSIRPSKLFDGVDQRLCICLAANRAKDQTTIWTTRYQHWNGEERSQLFPKVEYTLSLIHGRLKRIVQISGREAFGVMQKLEAKLKKTVDYYYPSTKIGTLMHYHRSPRYWIRAMDFQQHFKSQKRTRSIHHFRDIYFNDQSYGKFIGALLNSSLFFFWFISVGNGRNITGTDVEKFPVGDVVEELLSEMKGLFDRLMKDYENNSFIREREDCEFQEFKPSLSKPILDEIDRVLAIHYGFTEEELDFIINYDIKYRMGRDAEIDEG